MAAGEEPSGGGVRLFPAAVRYLATLLESTEAHDFLGTVQPQSLRRELMLYRQDLRMIIRRLTDDDMVAISTAFSERSAEILALIGDVRGYIEDQDAARLGVAMVKIGGILAESAELVGISLPPTVFLRTPIKWPVARPPDQGQPKQHGILRRIEDLLLGIFGPITFVYYALKGRPLVFDASDDFAKPDLYPPGDLFARRVFMSYERSSLPLAEKFDYALRGVGLEPYRYEPGKATQQNERNYTLEEFRAAYPDIAEEILRTVRRSSAAVFIVSTATAHSPMCQMEAFAAIAMYHPFCSGIYIVRESARVAVPELLNKVLVREQVYEYEEGLENIVAQDIAKRIDKLASFRMTAEASRKERWNKRSKGKSKKAKRES